MHAFRPLCGRRNWVNVSRMQHRAHCFGDDGSQSDEHCHDAAVGHKHALTDHTKRTLVGVHEVLRCCGVARGGASAVCESSAALGHSRSSSSSAYTAQYGDRVVGRSSRPRQYCTSVLVAVVGTPAGDSRPVASPRWSGCSHAHGKKFPGLIQPQLLEQWRHRFLYWFRQFGTLSMPIDCEQ